MLGESTAALDADNAARAAQVEVRLVDDVRDLAEVDRLFTRIWGGEPQHAVSIHVMRALAHTGNYVAAAFASDSGLVGASVGFLADGGASLHSHISGVDPGCQGQGIGYALKLHQRKWSSDRGVRRVTWTFDPLIRRNAWFNLFKLGARAESYIVDFYGMMHDGINGGDPTDRLFVGWEIDRLPQPVATERCRDLLQVGPLGEPVVVDAFDGEYLSCRVPADAVELRRRDPGLGREWRLALRATMGRAMQEGRTVVSFTAERGYLLS